MKEISELIIATLGRIERVLAILASELINKEQNL